MAALPSGSIGNPGGPSQTPGGTAGGYTPTPGAGSGGSVSQTPGGTAGSPGDVNFQGACIAAYCAMKAGFTGTGLQTIVAIGAPESGYNEMDHNSTPPDNSYGIWQINMIAGAHTLAEFSLTSNDQLFDPMINAKAAWVVSAHGTNFAPWSTFPGKSTPYMNEAARAIAAPVAPGTQAAGSQTGISLPSIPNPISSVADAITGAVNAITKQLVSFASTISMVGLIVILLLVGVWLIHSGDKQALKQSVKSVPSTVKKTVEAVATVA